MAHQNTIKLRNIESFLQQIDVFEDPKVSFEQYATTPHIAAHMLHEIITRYDEIANSLVVDLGCGCGVLSIGAAFVGASYCLGIDIDEEPLNICKSNLQDLEINNVDLLQYDLLKPLPPSLHKKFDIAIMNPPFGTKNNEGIDMEFVQKALSMADVVYSLHKTASRKRLQRQSNNMGIFMKPIAKINFDLPRTYKFHRKTSVDIDVDLIRFSVTKS